MEVTIRIEASGPRASGKSHELDKVRDLLESRGYRVDAAERDETGMPPSEILEMSRQGIWET